MPRCDTGAAAVCSIVLGAASLVFCTPPAAAQLQRNFSAQALRGDIAFTQPPEVQLNRRSARLAPGARIRSADNLMLVSGALAGQRLTVNYTLDTLGQIGEIWVLTPAEAARKPWPTTPEQAAAWRFDYNAQTWTRP